MVRKHRERLCDARNISAEMYRAARNLTQGETWLIFSTMYFIILIMYPSWQGYKIFPISHLPRGLVLVALTLIDKSFWLLLYRFRGGVKVEQINIFPESDTLKVGAKCQTSSIEELNSSWSTVSFLRS